MLTVENPNPCSRTPKTGYLSHNALEAVLEPLDSLVTVDLVVGSDLGLASSTFGNTLARSGHAAVEVHTVNTDRRVVLDSEIDVFADTETEVAGLAEVALAELIFLNLETSLENLLSLRTADSYVDGDLLVTTDTEGSDGVTGFAVDWGLTAQLFEHLGSTGKSITRLSHRDVEDDLLDPQILHRVGALILRFSHCDGC